MAQFNVTELDFDKIKENLISYYKNYPGGKYKDFDFEGSGLNMMMDILAHNTHYNAITAHTSINETFLDSAQLRSNVVSRAKLLGYTPNSIRSSNCGLTLEFNGSVNESEETFTLDSGKRITTSLNGKTYTFITVEDYTTTLVDGKYTFSNIEFHQGILKRQRFIVRDNADKGQKYVLKDNTADISHLKVKVYDNASSDSFSIYTKFSTFTDITDQSEIYFITENHDGNYEVEFGNNVYGKKPSGQNIIELEYISTSGEESNGATTFTWASSNPAPISITLESRASGGAIKEDIESIRFNAPLTFASQERAVTVDDYVALIKRDFPAASVVSVWGGQDNDPPQYGKVFISVKPNYENVLTDLQKDELKALLSSKNVASTIPEIIDPDFTYLYFNIFFKYNSNQTDLSKSDLETLVRNELISYNTSVLQSFNTVFRHSNFLKAIDNVESSILSTTTRVFAYKKKNLAELDTISSEFSFDFEIYGDIDDSESYISSDQFKYQGYSVRLGDEPLSDTTRQIYVYRVDSSGAEIKMINAVGTLTPSSGILRFNPIPTDQATTIKIYCAPASNDVVAKRNNLIQIDSNRSSITGDIDAVAVGGAAGAIDYTTYNRHS
jgi:hypothetical protein